MASFIDKIQQLSKHGKPIFGCAPLYPPLELFHSMGFTPLVLWGLRDTVAGTVKSDRHLQSYACSVARNLAEFVISESGGLLDGLFIYNACDTLRNLPEILECGIRESGREPPPLLKMHVPAVSPEQSPYSIHYIKKEINVLIQEMQKAFGVSFSAERFKESVALYRDMRRLASEADMLVAAGLISFHDYQQWAIDGCVSPIEEQIMSLQSLMKGMCHLAREPIHELAAGVILSGILPPPAAVTKLLEKAGIRVVGNDIALMHRSFAYTPEQDDDPEEYYSDFYRMHFPCTTLLSKSDERIAAIENLVNERKAHGFVFIGEKFCEYEYFEIPYIEKYLNDRNIPTLRLELSIEDIEPSAIKTRIEAFAEMLKSVS
jgi:benzoyl-CoA reductase/2-hydroxyglutaryl-CoA dehydratase subunit BcrC/BadD/HgdB